MTTLLPTKISRLHTLPLVLAPLLATIATAQEIQYAPAEEMGTPPKYVTHSISGMVISRDHEDVAWVHNDELVSRWVHSDSADGPRAYALSITTGKIVGIAELPIASPEDIDIEDIAIGPGPDKRLDYLYMADFGNDRRKKKSFEIHRSPEPVIKTGPDFQAATTISKSVETFTFTYPDPKTAVYDAQTLLVDPDTGEITIVTVGLQDMGKPGRSFIFRSDGPLSQTETNKLILVGTITFGYGPRDRATGGDVSPDGRWIIIRTNLEARIYARKPEQTVAQALLNPYKTITLAREYLGKAIAFDSHPANDSHPPTFYTATVFGSMLTNPDRDMQPIQRYSPLHTND